MSSDANPPAPAVSVVGPVLPPLLPSAAVDLRERREKCARCFALPRPFADIGDGGGAIQHSRVPDGEMARPSGGDVLLGGKF